MVVKCSLVFVAELARVQIFLRYLLCLNSGEFSYECGRLNSGEFSYGFSELGRCVLGKSMLATFGPNNHSQMV